MDDPNILKGKKILGLDDEPDILEAMKEHLYECDVEGASDFPTAKRLIETRECDLVILDIMEVNGFSLLEICGKRGLLAPMLTARAIRGQQAHHLAGSHQDFPVYRNATKLRIQGAVNERVQEAKNQHPPVPFRYAFRDG
jgi:DNA-binding NtrC family response regulator